MRGLPEVADAAGRKLGADLRVLAGTAAAVAVAVLLRGGRVRIGVHRQVAGLAGRFERQVPALARAQHQAALREAQGQREQRKGGAQAAGEGEHGRQSYRPGRGSVNGPNRRGRED